MGLKSRSANEVKWSGGASAGRELTLGPAGCPSQLSRSRAPTPLRHTSPGHSPWETTPHTSRALDRPIHPSLAIYSLRMEVLRRAHQNQKQNRPHSTYINL